MASMSQKVIGIDPGLADTGIGIVSGKGLKIFNYSYGSIHTDPSTPPPHRLKEIYLQIQSILADERPDLIILEDIFSLEKFPRSGIILGKVSGVVLLAAALHGVPVQEIPVREAKQVLTGNGRASKLQLERAVRDRLSLSMPIRPDHASDALGLAIIGLLRYCNIQNIQINESVDQGVE